MNNLDYASSTSDVSVCDYSILDNEIAHLTFCTSSDGSKP